MSPLSGRRIERRRDRADERPPESRRSTAGPPRCCPSAGRHRRCDTCRNGSAGRGDRPPGRHHQAVHALAEFRIALLLGQEVGARAAVARLPGVAAVGGVEHAGRGDADPDLLRVVADASTSECRISPAPPRLPVRPRRVFAQAVDMPPGLAAVVAAEQPGRLDAGVEAAVRRRRSRPP